MRETARAVGKLTGAAADKVAHQAWLAGMHARVYAKQGRVKAHNFLRYGWRGQSAPRTDKNTVDLRFSQSQQRWVPVGFNPAGTRAENVARTEEARARAARRKQKVRTAMAFFRR